MACKLSLFFGYENILDKTERALKLRNYSLQTINLALNAVKFLYVEVLKNPQKST